MEQATREGMTWVDEIMAGTAYERRTEHGRRQEDRDILALVGDLERALHAFKSPIIVREGT